MSNQKPGQLVVTPGAKFDRNQIASPVGLFNPDGSEFVGTQSDNSGGWQYSPPYQYVFIKVTSISEFEEMAFSETTSLPFEENIHMYVFDGANGKIYKSQGPNVAVDFDVTIQPKVGDIFLSKKSTDSSEEEPYESYAHRIWYIGNDNGVGLPHYLVIDGTVKEATETSQYLYNKDLCKVDASEDLIVACISNPDQESTEFSFYRTDDGTYSATIGGLVVNGEVSPEIPFGFSKIKNIKIGEGDNYQWVIGGAGFSIIEPGPGAGTSPTTVEITGTDSAGKITLLTGTGCSADQAVRVTLGRALPTKFVVEVSPVTEDTLAIMPSIYCLPDSVYGEYWDLLVSNVPLDDATEYSWYYSIKPF